MTLLLPALALALFSLATAENDCKTDQEMAYAKKFINEYCPKLDSKGKPERLKCFQNKGIDVQKYLDVCGTACTKDEQTAIVNKCCFLKKTIADGISIEKMESLDKECILK